MWGAVAASGLLLLATTAPGHGAGSPPAPIGGNVSDSGAVVHTLGQEQLSSMASSYYLNAGNSGPFYDFASTSVCGSPQPGDMNADVLCGVSWLMCRNASGGGPGPAVVIWRREVNPDGTPVGGSTGDWRAVDITCFPELVPGAGNVLTMAMIQRAFHDTDFSIPTVNIQPEGDVTLVNLPTYFEVEIPEAGFGPDEVDTPDPATLLGHRIEVRPRLKSVTYHLGERTIGPTTDLGGPYPDGSIVQTYTHPGTVQVRVDIVYTGQFRVSGSDWFDIPGQVDLQGTPVSLDVREATARLYGSSGTGTG